MQRKRSHSLASNSLCPFSRSQLFGTKYTPYVSRAFSHSSHGEFLASRSVIDISGTLVTERHTNPRILSCSPFLCLMRRRAMSGALDSLQDQRLLKRSFPRMLGVSSRCAVCLKLMAGITEKKMVHPTEFNGWPTEYQPVVPGICRPCSKYKRVWVRRPVTIEYPDRLPRMVLCRDTPGRDTTRTSELY